MRSIFYILLFFISFGAAAQNDVLFEKANKLYNQDRYQEAIDTYKKILETGEHSAELYYNIANANYKLSNIGPSVYYYEKALLLAPDDEDIKNNLAFAQNMTIDAIDVIPQTGISKIVNNVTGMFDHNGWAKLAIAFVFAFVLLFLLYYFSYRTSIKRIYFITSILSLAFMVVSVVFAFQRYESNQKDNPGIVFAQEAVVRVDPKLSSEEAFVLHEGTKVQVDDNFDQWMKIRLSDGKVGWIPSEDIKLLKDF